MTIQGGGGGKKIPPGGPPKAPAAAGKSDPPKAAEVKPSSTATATKTDGFERGESHFASEQAHLPTSEAKSSSGVNSMVRLLEETRAQIIDEHKLLREKSIRLVSEFARAGFDRALIEKRKEELAGLRARLSQLRKRLGQIQRRLKTAMAQSAKHGDVDVGKAIAAQLERMKKLEPGLQRALLALVAMEQAFAGVVDGGVLQLLGEATADERGSVLARLAPGSIISRATVSLLSGRPAQARLSASTEGAPVVDVGVDVVDVGVARSDGLDGLRGLAATLLLSLAPPEDAP